MIQLKSIIIAISLILFFGLWSCNISSNKAERNRAEKEIELTPDKDTIIKLSDYFEEKYSIIELKGTTLGYIQSIINIDSLFIVQGNSTDGLLLTFDKSGNFIKPLLRKGQGPDEVLHLGTVKAKDEKIFALVNMGRELWQINPKTHSVEKKTVIPKEACYPEDFDFLNENIIFFKQNINNGISGTQYHINIYNPITDKIIIQQYPIDSESSLYISFSKNGILQSISDSTALFMKSFMQGIDLLSSNRIEPYIGFKKNIFTFPDEKLHGENSFWGFFKYCENCDYIWGHNTFSKGNKIIISNFTYQGKYYINFIDINNSSSQSALQVYDDIVTGRIYNLEDDTWGHIVGTKNSKFMIHYPPEFFNNTQLSYILNNNTFTSTSDSTTEIIIVLHEK